MIRHLYDFLLLLICFPVIFANYNEWTEIPKKTGHEYTVDRQSWMYFGPEYEADDDPDGSASVLTVMRVGGILLLFYQMSAICFYIIKLQVLNDLGETDDDNNLIQTMNKYVTSNDDKLDTVEEKGSQTLTKNRIMKRTAEPIKTKEEATQEIIQEPEIKLKKSELQSQRLPRARKGYQSDFLDKMEKWNEELEMEEPFSEQQLDNKTSVQKVMTKVDKTHSAEN